MQTRTPLVKLAARDPTAEDIAAEAVARWRQLDGALSPIIGRRGIEAIYKRALEIIQVDYPWLDVANENGFAFNNFVSLQRALARQTSKRAAAGNLAFYQCFTELLAGLIGPSLTKRLLQSIVTSLDDHVFQAAPSRLRKLSTIYTGC